MNVIIIKKHTPVYKVLQFRSINVTLAKNQSYKLHLHEHDQRI